MNLKNASYVHGKHPIESRKGQKRLVHRSLIVDMASLVGYLLRHDDHANAA